LRPGRIDRKIEYKLASQQQARALYNRFFPATRFADTSDRNMGKQFEVQYAPNADELADTFARKIPEHEFSVAELQGYLLDWKMKPLDAVQGVEEWIEAERELRLEKEAREAKRKERLTAAKVQQQLQVSSAVIAGIGSAMAQGQIAAFPAPTSNEPSPPPPPKVDSGSISPSATSGEGPDDTVTDGVLNSHPTSPIPSASEAIQ
jgi:mitochondrial chaperone BCS1